VQKTCPLTIDDGVYRRQQMSANIFGGKERTTKEGEEDGIKNFVFWVWWWPTTTTGMGWVEGN